MHGKQLFEIGLYLQILLRFNQDCEFIFCKLKTLSFCARTTKLKNNEDL